MSHDVQSEFSRSFSVSALIREGLDTRLEATPEECTALAKRLGLEKVSSLLADVRARPWQQGLAIRAAFSAGVTQICGISLETMSNEVNDSFEISYLPEKLLKQLKLEGDSGELLDQPEILPQDVLDIGELVVEHLALAINPYPRKDGAVLGAAYGLCSDYIKYSQDGDSSPEAEPKIRPFSGLEELKNHLK